MTNIELKALRRLFFLYVADAVTYIGKCSKRAWQYRESGSRKIPDDVINIMNKLKEERTELLYYYRLITYSVIIKLAIWFIQG
ncbi:DUF1870 family protein [Gilliamella apis]|uniref:Uncharacterized protein n=1 Tax=Gilliamella apis TaxID=1970738 RepID=A0A242NVI0_9GAMM|nr:DUF1870 family protein [Gilliamella apis]OTQ34218.1 hypothetical protein B6C84_10460 [Gilliamella apis]OTQ34919.1 hypothetical protein B6C88_10660 [Gilliamella apis]OTQ37731.1 hypothetical protein B6D26_11475 [Gilliamella apis]OTQ40259.1 hypothetical protein B6C94_10395 [Gilliamella apis]OTQ50616.1 hypothetical protein B6D06_03895 [Gilliamella apis]